MKMRFFSLASILLLSVIPAQAAWAHGKEQHIMGTVKQVDDKSIALETSEKKEIQVQINDKTKFEKSGAPGVQASSKDVKAGERVVIHASKREGKLTASTVKIAAEVKDKATAAGSGSHHADKASKPAPPK